MIGGDALARKIALDVAPLAAPWVGGKLGGEVGKAVGEGLKDVFEHHKGLIEVGKELLIDPYY
jgi:hypothetical protein